MRPSVCGNALKPDIAWAFLDSQQQRLMTDYVTILDSPLLLDGTNGSSYLHMQCKQGSVYAHRCMHSEELMSLTPVHKGLSAPSHLSKHLEH